MSKNCVINQALKKENCKLPPFYFVTIFMSMKKHPFILLQLRAVHKIFNVFSSSDPLSKNSFTSQIH